jgi:hypothetical protein
VGLAKEKTHMKNQIRFAITLAGVVLFALPNLAMAQSGPGDSQDGQAAAIEGTWIVTIHRVVTGVTFSALQSFTAGGVTVATGSGDRLPAPMSPPYSPPLSPLYGSWKRVDENNYIVTICFFAFDSSGSPLGMIKTPEALHMVDDNNLTGTGTGLACDINGNNCVNINSPITVTGKRLIAQAP